MSVVPEIDPRYFTSIDCYGCYGINDLESRLEVIGGRCFSQQSKAPRVYDFLLVLSGNLGPILLCFRDIRALVGRKPPAFRYPSPISAKIQGVPLGVDP